MIQKSPLMYILIKIPMIQYTVKYTTVDDVKNTIIKLEKLYKANKYTHKRIWQVGMILKVRLEVINKYKNTRYPNVGKNKMFIRDINLL